MLELNIVAHQPAPAVVSKVKKQKKTFHRNKHRIDKNIKRRQITENRKLQQQHEKETTTTEVDDVNPNEYNTGATTFAAATNVEESNEQVPKAEVEDLATFQSTRNRSHARQVEPQSNPVDNSSTNTKEINDSIEREKYAEYLAQFHPRIHELDRKSGVVATSIPVSEPSKHLFDTNEDDEVSPTIVVRTKTTKATIEHLTVSDNPWKRLQVHSSLQMVLERQSLLKPTVIQRRAISYLLQHHRDAMNVLIQSETGSGKTLAYLLPILQNIMQEVIITQQEQQHEQQQRLQTSDKTDSVSTSVSRQSVGTKCIILVPTRELALQIFQVVQSFCSHFSSQYFVSSSDTSSSNDNASLNLSNPVTKSSSSLSSPHFLLVAGCLSGGEKRKSEKARLRKGLHILVATPGRLLDHLEKTSCFSWRGSLRYLVMDEADRLVVDMHDVVQEIVTKLQMKELPPSTPTTRNKDTTVVSSIAVSWQTILVSATVSPKVQALAQDLLLDVDLKADTDWTRHWHWIKGATANSSQKDDDDPEDLADSTPRQLSHIHLTVSAKFRLASLVAFLVQCVQRHERVVVFMSTCDGVDFHYALFQAMTCLIRNEQPSKTKITKKNKQAAGDNSNDDREQTIFGSHGKVLKLHGNMPHPDRQAILREFTKTTNTWTETTARTSTILLATDVAARGLNLPHVDWIVQYDPPMDVAEYVHRAGRTARAGQAGHTLLFLLPSERGLLDVFHAKGVGTAQPHLLKVLQERKDGSEDGEHDSCPNMTALSLSRVLDQAAKACLPSSSQATTKPHRLGETFCTELHRQIESCLADDVKEIVRNNRSGGENNMAGPTLSLSDMARAAFLSYMRAYPTKEKAIRHIFSVRALHVGHVARSFGLREAPSSLAQRQRRQNERQVVQATTTTTTTSSQRRHIPSSSHERRGKHNADLPIEHGSSTKKRRTMERSNTTTTTSTKSSTSHRTHKQNSEGKSNPQSGRSILLANAAKLQQHSMDAF